MNYKILNLKHRNKYFFVDIYDSFINGTVIPWKWAPKGFMV